MRHHGLQIDADRVTWLALGEPVHPALALRISLFSILFHHQIMRHHGLGIDADRVTWLALGEPAHPALALRISLLQYFISPPDHAPSRLSNRR
ncbi:hypothetical protein [Janthinobacterium agaricidamnosum]|uniref:hypothetical protein n=1 Tax=Janthinobacterium agaricidamnosum TaxID=55508 RepID=UPI001969F561|nr:hypothetical protein [Janthinobacterium agaricidamnosum]